MSDEEAAAAAGQGHGGPPAAADAGGGGERRASRNNGDLSRHLRELAGRPSSRDCLNELAELELLATAAALLDADTAQAYLQAAAQHLMVVVPGSQRGGGGNRQGSNLQQVLAEVLQVRCCFVLDTSIYVLSPWLVVQCGSAIQDRKTDTGEPAKYYGMCLDLHPLSQTPLSC